MSETPETRLAALGLTLPTISKPAGNLLGYKVDQGQVFVSGQLPLEDGVPRYIGKVGDAFTKDDAYQAARLAALNVVAQLFLVTNENLSAISAIVKVSGFVNCTSDFTDIPFVINGASDLLVELFGARGSHARFALGVASLPRGVPVEIDVIARIRNGA